ncbi:uncharacterized protein YALI1_A19195g [Yarrowia lipolytica]|uniref:Uncharacterized protein n=1 Tax=Yarrowia lipolytica TaxID=4952 RepID=A0A1D8N5C3_YARLL|nr:hypothetical protein YALI1_A19195g [Yarrowia lipolytica]
MIPVTIPNTPNETDCKNHPETTPQDLPMTATLESCSCLVPISLCLCYHLPNHTPSPVSANPISILRQSHLHTPPIPSPYSRLLNPCAIHLFNSSSLSFFSSSFFPFFSHSFPILFPFFSHSFPILFPFFSHSFPILFPYFSL